MTVKKRILIAALILLFVIAFGFCVLNWNTNKEQMLPSAGVIQTEDDAITIGKTIIQRVYPQFEYDSLKWDVLYQPKENIWSVWCCKNEAELGGGFPQIDIKKQTGEVVFLGLTV